MENENNGQEQLTIKEQREVKRLEKEQRRSEAGKIAQRAVMYRIVLWVFVIVVLCAAIFALVKLANTPSSSTGNGPNGGVETDILSSVSSADWVRDNANATTTVIEYGDFQCPACEAFYPITKQVDQKYGKSIRFIFRNFPLSQHPNAHIAAQAAEAAGIQGKYWEMHDMLYEKQSDWASLSNSDATNLFNTYAQQLGLNVTKFKSDFASDAVTQKIDKSYQDGIGSYNIDATPTFFLNNEKLPPPTSAQEFYQEIQNAIQGANGTNNATTSASK